MFTYIQKSFCIILHESTKGKEGKRGRQSHPISKMIPKSTDTAVRASGKRQYPTAQHGGVFVLFLHAVFLLVFVFVTNRTLC